MTVVYCTHVNYYNFILAGSAEVYPQHFQSSQNVVESDLWGSMSLTITVVYPVLETLHWLPAVRVSIPDNKSTDHG